MLIRLMYFIFALGCFKVGIETLFSKIAYGGGKIYDFRDDGCYYFIPSISILLLGLACSYLAFRPKRHIKPQFTKCPKCKTLFKYKETNHGICPKCNVSTVDIKKYYENRRKIKEERYLHPIKKKKR